MKVLFQGDSITDAGRDYQRPDSLGRGYAFYLAAKIGLDAPNAHSFVNRGISGNRIVDLYARIKKDLLNLQPEVLSLLVGINDVWHEAFDQNGVDAEKFERVYDWLLLEARQALPQLRILLMEPFVLPGLETADRWEEFHRETLLRAAAVKRLAKKHGAQFIPLQAPFETALQRAPAECWLHDGVHPTPAGHALIAREWQPAFDRITKPA